MSEKLYGIKELIKKDMILPGREIIERPYTVIPTTPCLDIALGGGIKSGSFVTLSGKPKSGKAQPLDSLVMTPDGPKKMGDIQLKDIVCTPFGDGVAKVDGIFPQGKISTYKVTFNDGTSIECSGDHLWYVRHTRKDKYEILTLKQIVQQGLHIQAGNSKKRNKWRVPLTQPVNFNKRGQLIHPYVMGCLIGDGGFTSGSVCITNIDKELLKKFEEKLEYGYYLSPQSTQVENNISYRIVHGRGSQEKNYYKNVLISYRLWNKKSNEKFIPEDYLYSSVSDRWELLQGLLDTDGSITTNGHIEYSTTSLKLVNNLITLVQSLGGIAKFSSRTTTCDGKEFDSFRVHILFTDKSNCFYISRKSNKTKERKKLELSRSIESVEFVGYKECQCIHLDDDNHLYLTDGFVVTHNTTMALQIIANAQKEKYGKRDSFYFDIEFRLGKKELTGIEGLIVAENNNDFGLKVIQSSKDHILSAEDILNSAEELITMYPGCIIVLDSASAMSTANELAEQVTATSRSQSPRLFASFLRKVKEKVPLHDCIFMNISHLIANTSGYGPSVMEDGGNKKEYQNDTKIRIKGFEKWEEGDEHIGQEVTWQVFWSALGKPGKLAKTRLRYGMGYDKVEEIITLALDMALVKQGGAGWITYSKSEEEKKIQGRANFANILRSDEVLLTTLENQIKELIA